MKPFLRCTALALLVGSMRPEAAQAQISWTYVSTPWARYGFGVPALMTLRAPAQGVVWGIRPYNLPGGPGNSVWAYQLFTSSDNGQTVQQSEVASSNDGGTGAGGSNVIDLWATDAQHVWVVTQGTVSGARTLLRSTTGSTALAALPAAATPATLRTVRFFNATAGVAIADAGAATTWPIFRTVDGGTTWQPIANTPAAAAGEVATDVALLGPNLWATSNRGNVLRSTDSGQTWSIQATGLTNLQSASFTDALHGLAYDRLPTQLAVTADGGLTWALVTPSGPMRRCAIQALLDVPGAYLSVGPGSYQVPNDPSGTAISTDNGATWRSLETFSFHRGLAVWNSANIWAGGDYGWAASGSSIINFLVRSTGTLLATRTGQLAQHKLAVYPNPTAGPATVAAATPGQKLKVYNAIGQVQFQQEMPTAVAPIDLSNLPAGIYQVVTEGKLGRQAARLTVVR
ncbi:T9SS type A sorting domain-containing protein [Hymenobacter monticola]|uniref:T9SS type A sorting domain-containing protein n=1 Tax=Hymenobacter monticola TaxID=1705399 RepID=A0ABY4B1S2_9BACT|nr:T9SS type A sorting domain-containing protein [Hymenobacter monticola]UOE33079.1 T9SS type A sorting domain-containing protein [Hymenobacter monticola]